MRNNIKRNNSPHRGSLVGALVFICAAFAVSAAQTPSTPGGTTISSQARLNYSEGTQSYATLSNSVAVTVSNIADVANAPAAGTNPTLALDQTLLDFKFTVTSTDNFSNPFMCEIFGAL